MSDLGRNLVLTAAVFVVCFVGLALAGSIVCPLLHLTGRTSYACDGCSEVKP